MKMAYPMSSHVCALGNVAALSYQAREVACHAFEVYTRKLKGKVLLAQFLKIFFFFAYFVSSTK